MKLAGATLFLYATPTRITGKCNSLFTPWAWLGTCSWSWPTASAAVLQIFQAVNSQLSTVNFHPAGSRPRVDQGLYVAGIGLEMKVAPAEGSISPSLKVTSVAPIGGSSPLVKVTPPLALAEGRRNQEEGQTSHQPTGNVAGKTNLEVPGQTKLDLSNVSKPNQANLPEKGSPSSAISQTSLQQSSISDCYQHPASLRSGFI